MKNMSSNLVMWNSQEEDWKIACWNQELEPHDEVELVVGVAVAAAALVREE